MPKRTVYHIVPADKGWQIKKEGASRASKSFRRKQDAVDYGRQRARAEKPSQLKIHKGDGTDQRQLYFTDTGQIKKKPSPIS